MKGCFIVSAVIIAMLAVTGGAGAAEPVKDEGFATRLFAGKIGKEKSYACFVRRYDAAHLAQHPLQKVSGMKLLVTAEKVPDAEALTYSFRLGIQFRNRSGKFESEGSCGQVMESQESADKLHLGCGIDCDGGGLSVELTNGDKSTLVRTDEIRIWRSNGSPEEGLSLQGGADDRAFRLDRADLQDCRTLVSDREERTAMLRK